MIISWDKIMIFVLMTSGIGHCLGFCVSQTHLKKSSVFGEVLSSFHPWFFNILLLLFVRNIGYSIQITF